MSIGRLALAAAFAAPLVATPAIAPAQDRDAKAFEWSGKVAGDGWLRIRNLNGTIDVVGGSGDRIEVTATRTWEDDANPEAVRFEVKQEGADVVICALWATYDDGDAECGRRYRQERVHRRARKVQAHFTVKLPRGVRIDASAVNGDVDVRDAAAATIARSVNGSVRVTSGTSPVSASSVNGSVDVEIAAVTGAGEMDFHSVNGSVTVVLPATLDADIELSTVNGEFRSDFPLTIRGRFNGRRMEGQIGRGGPEIKLRTVNGDVEIRKRS